MTRTTLAVTVAALMTVLASGREASAQTREGFWLSLGGGYGSADATCDGCGSGDREGGGAGYIKAGWALNEQLLIGVEGNLWMKEYSFPELGGDATVAMYNVSAIATYYPMRSGGFFVSAGAGLSMLDMEVDLGGTSVESELGTGLGMVAGAGYDIPMGRISITPAANFWYGRPGDLVILGETIATGWKQNVIAFTVGLTFP